MSNCYNCGTEFTLKEEEVKCDSCGNIVNFPCHNCKQWFSVMNEDGSPIQQCKACGFYSCPNCGVCGTNCQKESWAIILREIIPTITSEQQRKLLEFIEDIKLNKNQLNCPQGVPISYAKSRIKSCIARMMGYRIKSQIDLEKFKQRVDEVRESEIGKKYTVNRSREAGSYGQEWRDVFNYCVCLGELGKKKVKIEDKEYDCFIRCEKGMCKMLNATKLVIKVCTNPKCKIKEFPLSQEYCCYCKYKKGNKAGQFYKLKIKLNNKDTCQLNRNDFKKEEDEETKYRPDNERFD